MTGIKQETPAQEAQDSAMATPPANADADNWDEARLEAGLTQLQEMYRQVSTTFWSDYDGLR